MSKVLAHPPTGLDLIIMILLNPVYLIVILLIVFVIIVQIASKNIEAESGHEEEDEP